MHEVAPESYTDHAVYQRTRRPVADARTLIREAYVSDEFFAVERERVFASGWVAVGCAEAVREPGEVLVVDVAGRSVIVLRGRDGAVRAFYNVCRHRGTRLLETGERRVGRFIRCPYHHWAYDLDGRCVGTPLFADAGIPDDQRAIFATDHAPAFDRGDHGLLDLAVTTFGPVILLNLEPEREALVDHLGDLAGYRLEEWRLARDDPAANDAIDRLASFWHTVNREDSAIVQRVHEGLATTPFPGGPMCYRFEEPVHRFQNMIADLSTASRTRSPTGWVGLRRVPAGDASARTPLLDNAHEHHDIADSV